MLQTSLGTVGVLCLLVSSAADGLENRGANCWNSCNSQSGPCSWCGTGYCCRGNWNGGENGCTSDMGGALNHECVEQPATTCNGSALAVANAARSGGTATGGPTGAAGATEVDSSTVIYMCSNSMANATYTCSSGSFGAAVYSEGTECPEPATCVSVDKNYFCGASKAFNWTNHDSECALGSCNNNTPSDVETCCHSLYTFVEQGVASPSTMLVSSANSLEECYLAVKNDTSCSKHFTYAARGNKNCGCVKRGAELTITTSSSSDYYLNIDKGPLCAVKGGSCACMGVMSYLRNKQLALYEKIGAIGEPMTCPGDECFCDARDESCRWLRRPNTMFYPKHDGVLGGKEEEEERCKNMYDEYPTAQKACMLHPDCTGVQCSSSETLEKCADKSCELRSGSPEFHDDKTKIFTTLSLECRYNDIKACVGWKQTGRCHADGPREPQNDKTCTAMIPKGASGYCECEHGRKAMMKGCLDGKYENCNDACADFARCSSIKDLPGFCEDGNVYDPETRDLECTTYPCDQCCDEDIIAPGTAAPADDPNMVMVGQVELEYGEKLSDFDKVLLEPFVCDEYEKQITESSGEVVSLKCEASLKAGRRLLSRYTYNVKIYSSKDKASKAYLTQHWENDLKENLRSKSSLRSLPVPITIGFTPSGQPSCSDMMQNGDETGVDKGGSCPKSPKSPSGEDPTNPFVVVGAVIGALAIFFFIGMVIQRENKRRQALRATVMTGGGGGNRVTPAQAAPVQQQPMQVQQPMPMLPPGQMQGQPMQMQAQPMQVQPAYGQPMEAQPAYGQPIQPMQGLPVYGQPMQGQPMQGQPIQGQPMQGQPMQGQPMQGQPMQGQPMQGQPMQGQPPAYQPM